MLAVEAHVADVDQLLLQRVAHKAAKRVVTDAPDKPADAAKTGDTYRHVGRRAAGAAQQTAFALRQQVNYRISQNPNFCNHAEKSP